jgi:hypothetical protein
MNSAIQEEYETMANSGGIDAYPDVHQALAYALRASGPREMPFPDPASAIKFVSRCSTFRRLLRKENGRCEYDALRISRVDAVVTFTHWAQTAPVMRDPATGQTVELKPEYSQDEMNRFAEEIKREQGARDYVEYCRNNPPTTGPDAYRKAPDLTVLQKPGESIFDD